MSTPGQLPGPPSNLKSKKLTLFEFEGQIFRSHGIDRSPLFFGKTGLNRFDAPDKSYGVLYAGSDPFCAFIETFAKAAGTRIVTTTELHRRALAQLKANRTLRLVDLIESGTLVRIGADSRLFSAEHEIAQLWSKALHDHPAEPDGLVYPSRLDPTKKALALFSDRVPQLVELSRQSWYTPGPQRQLLARIIEHYEIELIENRFVAQRKRVATARQHGLPLND